MSYFSRCSATIFRIERFGEGAALDWLAGTAADQGQRVGTLPIEDRRAAVLGESGEFGFVE